MARTVADQLLDRLEEWGIRTIFGYSADGINGILGALDRAVERFDFIQPRHEEMAEMVNSGERVAIRHYYPRWADPRLIVCVLNNGDLNMVTWEMRAFEGNPRYEESQEVPSFPYAEFAEMIGLRGIRVEKPEEVGPAWDQLLEADRPSLLEVVCDPDVPTIPPHVTLDQFGKYMSALLKGDSETLGVVWQSARQGWQALTTR